MIGLLYKAYPAACQVVVVVITITITVVIINIIILLLLLLLSLLTILVYIPAKAKALSCQGTSALVALACHACVHPVTENRHVLQAKQDKFKGAVLTDSAGNPIEEQPPLLVDRRNPMQPLDLDASLQDSVLKEPVLEFAAIFISIKLLPTAVANAVPSQTSGAALAPPAAFQVSFA